MKERNKEWPRWTPLGIIGLIVCAVCFILAVEALPATYFKFTYPSVDGVSGRFVITNEASGDSIAGGVLTETERAALTYWKGSSTLDPGSYTVEGFIFEESDTSIGSYRVDVYPQAINDTLLILQDTLEAQDDWIAQQAVLDLVALYTGACDSCYQILYPRSGAANKDSVVVFDKEDSKIAKVVFKHGTVPAVYDTSYFYIAPWWP